MPIKDIDLSKLTEMEGFRIWNSDTRNSLRLDTAGDINKDGINDIIIGDNDQTSWIVYGKKGGAPTTDLSQITLAQGFKISGASIGKLISSVGDVNGDGISDIMVGNEGVSYVIYGNSQGFIDIDITKLTLSQGFKITCASIYTVRRGGDINSDGIDDIIIGSPDIASPISNQISGVSYIIYGQKQGLADINIDFISPAQTPVFIVRGVTESAIMAGNAGDINGDGIDDIAIAIPINYVNSAILIYSKAGGFSGIIDVANLTLPQAYLINPTTSYGLSFSNVNGDINGDGIDDIFMLDKGDNNNVGYTIYGENERLNNIYLNNFTNTEGFLIHHSRFGEMFIDNNGDINGDGIDDILIGLPLSSPLSRQYTGQSYVIYGNKAGFNNIDLANFNNNIGFSIYGPNSYTQTGYDVRIIGDINGDKYDDIAIGAMKANGNVWFNYIVYGSNVNKDLDLANFNNAQGFQILSYYKDSFSVHEAGDVNDDGYDDLIIGDPGRCQTYIVYGSKIGSEVDLYSLKPPQGFIIHGTSYSINNEDQTGWSVSKAGDINGDSIDDIILSAPGVNIISTAGDIRTTGIVYVIYGNKAGFNDIYLANLSFAQGFKILGVNSNDRFGSSVSYLNNLYHDNISDVIISAYTRMNDGINYIIHGKRGGYTQDLDLAMMGSTQALKIYGEKNNDRLGALVNKAGDINGDGIDDVILGAPGASPLSRYGAGITYLIYGSKEGFATNLDLVNLQSSQGFKILGINANGYAASSAGDINGDGINDIMLGFFESMTILGQSYSNLICIIYGQNKTSQSNIDLTNLSSQQGFILYNTSATSISTAGDINGDGYDDMMIGASSAYTSGAGEVYIIYGQKGLFSNIDLANFNHNQGFRILGYVPGDAVGSSVSNGGDINGDGIDDMIIGAINTGGYVIYGSHSFMPEPTSEPNNDNNWFYEHEWEVLGPVVSVVGSALVAGLGYYCYKHFHHSLSIDDSSLLS